MSKARTLANLMSDNAELADGQIGVAEVVGAAPLASPTFTGTVTSTGNIVLGDNDKAIFGAGSDLQIYHSGADSYITDAGAGALVINTNELKIRNAAGNEEGIYFVENGAVTLSHNNVARLSTTATGVAIGVSSSDHALVVRRTDGDSKVLELSTGDSSATMNFSRDGNPTAFIKMFEDGSTGTGALLFGTGSSASPTERMRITSSGNVGIAKSSLATWSSGYNALQVGGRGFVGAHSSSDLYIGQNASYNSGWKYEASVAASMTQHSGGKITHFVAPAGTAGNAISWTSALDITPIGNVGIGTVPENTIKADIYSGSITSPMRLRFVDDNNSNASGDPFYSEYKAGLEIENSYSGAAPSANGTKVAKIQLTTVTANGYGASGSMMAVAESNGYDAGALVFSTGSDSSGLETEHMRIGASGVLTSKSHIVTGIDNTAFEVKTNHSGNPSALRIAGGGSINGISSSFQNFTVLNVAADSGSGISAHFNGHVKTAGNFVVTSGKGISFAATGAGTDTGGTNETLSDFETGTWSPKLTDINGNEASYTSGFPKGTYIKVGRHVWVNFVIRITAKNSMTGNYVFVANLPFAKDSTAEGRGTGTIDYFSGFAQPKSYLALDCSSTQTVLWLVGGTNATGSSYVPPSHLNNACMFRGGANYIAT